mmetsp:Transcript_36188/g.71946  ORF Transcript_36188/g.71946 Transcript_36188/m.71946 type:complete len:303 (+) Transcript_36188:95-1003(+)
MGMVQVLAFRTTVHGRLSYMQKCEQTCSHQTRKVLRISHPSIQGVQGVHLPSSKSAARLRVLARGSAGALPVVGRLDRTTKAFFGERTAPSYTTDTHPLAVGAAGTTLHVASSAAVTGPAASASMACAVAFADCSRREDSSPSQVLVAAAALKVCTSSGWTASGGAASTLVASGAAASGLTRAASEVASAGWTASGGAASGLVVSRVSSSGLARAVSEAAAAGWAARGDWAVSGAACTTPAEAAAREVEGLRSSIEMRASRTATRTWYGSFTHNLPARAIFAPRAPRLQERSTTGQRSEARA